MKKINLLYLITELLILILISTVTLIATIVISFMILIDYITEGLKNGFRRNITSIRRS